MLIEKGGVGGSFGVPGRAFSGVAEIQHNI